MDIKKLTPAQCEQIYNEAHAAGMAAGNAVTPVPMIVQQRANPLDDNSPVVQEYHEPEGLCGFAWINIRPANSRFANWCRKAGKGSTDSYYGGLCVWVGEFNQSITRKERYARVFAEVLQKYGIDCYAQSRLD